LFSGDGEDVRSPCLTCEYKDEDKNSERCINCKRRLAYARKEFMIPEEGKLMRESLLHGFKVYAGGKKYYNEPKIRIWVGGTFNFNSSFVDRYGIKSYDYAVLLYNESTEQIAIKFTHNGDELGALKVTAKNQPYANINLKSFFNLYGLQDRNLDLRFRYEEEADVFIVTPIKKKKIKEDGE
jgi:hypothetical protein